jgi:hypothetical protein
VGPKTIQAIHQFQKRQLGWSDGRVDSEQSGGTTIVALKKFDPTPDSSIEPTPAPQYPSQPEGKGASSGKSGWSGGKLGGSGGQSGGKLGSGGAGGKFGGSSGPGVKSF